MKYFPFLLTLFKKPFLNITSITALPALIAKGFPPNVDPWVPGFMPEATFLLTKTAPIGKPPPIPFAIGTISGLIFAYSNAKNLPLLPIPHCTSSRINKIFFSLQIFLKYLRHLSGIVFDHLWRRPKL